MDGRAGHIPGAASLHYARLYTETGMLRPKPELRAIFEEAGYSDEDQVVAYCHIGYWASAVVFAARTLGMDARLYDGSMTEWAQDPDLPLVLPPGQ
jgi:thiosulfate/3-mercaptopyruvate sulfurtransferase